jgi:methionine-gamma-lyase
MANEFKVDGRLKNSLTTNESYDSKQVFEQRIVQTREQIERQISKAGFDLEASTQDVATPFKRVAELADIEAGQLGQWYNRFGSIAEFALCQLLVQLEAGYLTKKGINPLDHLAATVFPSGMGAIDTVARHLVRQIPITERQGKRVLHGETVYFNTNDVFGPRMEEMGLEAALRVDTGDTQELKTTLQQNPKVIAVYFEPVTNPLIQYTDTREVSEVVREHNVPVIVDNTFLTPYLQQPLRMGADVVIHSLTKYMNGQGDLTAGVVIGPKELIKEIRNLQTESGMVISSAETALTLYNRVSELPQRMEQHLANAREITDFLKSPVCRKYVQEVYFPELTTRDTRYGLPGAVVSFTPKGDTPEQRQQKEAELMQYVIEHPGSLVHKVSLGESDHLFFGETTFGYGSGTLPFGVVRLAVGRKSADDAIQHLKAALENVYRD